MMDFNEDSKHFQEEIIRKKFKFDDTLFESRFNLNVKSTPNHS